ncbi:MAG: adenylate/guanylate cyclase domain-containing protein [Nevskiaceae bacterium]
MTDLSGPRSGQPTRQLAAIMFTDLVGYSAMAHRDEALAIELLELHRTWVRAILPRFGGREVETVGDAFLVEFGSALAAVECAVAIQQRFADYNEHATPTRRMKLRIGIHLGDVEHAGDKVMGDGVNVASRIHGMAEPGGICVSQDVQRAVRNRGELKFTSMGSPKLKNIETPLELFEVHAGGGGRRAAIVAGVKRKVGWVPRWLWITVAVIVLINVLSDDDGKGPGPGNVEVEPRDEPPAIAVLPFENLSNDPDAAFFTDGLHDTVIGHLSRVSGLKVISRTSVMGYRGKQKNLRRIGRELGADHILEGSVQRAGGRLRVAAQLIDTDTDTHLWSQEYDRELKDVFAVQADIAQSVAAAVHAKLTPQEQAGIEAIPTTHPGAYDMYLRAVLVERRADPKPQEVREAIDLLDQAVAIDPQFALAYALLAHLHDGLYWSGVDPSDARRALVEKNADAALRLNPKLAEAHVAKALYHYHGSRNYQAALAELEVARGLASGNAKVHFWLGPIYRRQARWDEAMESLDRATALDPMNTAFQLDRAGTLQMMRRYGEAQEAFDRIASQETGNPVIPVISAFNQLFARGSLAPLEQAVAKLPPGFDPNCQATGMRVGLAVLQHRFEAARAAGLACKETVLPSSGGAQIPMEYFVAQVKWLASRQPPPEAETARAILERTLAEKPDLAETRMHLAGVLVMLGQKERAMAEAERALADLPMERDALAGASLRRTAVDIFANCGAIDRALSELAQVLRVPNGGHVYEMKLDPFLDPLRGDPRFEKLLAEHLPKPA